MSFSPTAAKEKIKNIQNWKDSFTDTQKDRNNLFGLITFLPSVLFLGIFVLIPVLYIFYLSFTDIGLLETSGEWIGLDNYRYVFSSSFFSSSLWTGVVFATLSVAFQLVVGLMLALLLNTDEFDNPIIRTVVILPYLVPVISVVFMWEWMLDPQYGVVNHILLSSGLIGESIDFFGTEATAMPSVIVGSGWKYVAFVTLVLLARLQAIDQSLYEQAKISGASRIQMFRTITLPNLRSAILLVVFLRLVWMFNKFGVIWLFTRGGPVDSTTTLPVYVYRITFSEFNLGAGSAGAMTLFFILAICAVIYFKVFQPSEEIETQV